MSPSIFQSLSLCSRLQVVVKVFLGFNLVPRAFGCCGGYRTEGRISSVGNIAERDSSAGHVAELVWCGG